MTPPEETLLETQTWETIDRKLTEAGWVIQDKKRLNLYQSLGVAVREMDTDSGPADYMLFIDGKACGIIEAKREGTDLGGVAEQSARYATSQTKFIERWVAEDQPLPLLYEATNHEIRFQDERDPQPRSRNIFHFHRPETLLDWLQEEETLRTRLRQLPELNTKNLRACQIDAINGIEHSLKQAKPRALLQMATGSGKTYTAVTHVYRLAKFAKIEELSSHIDAGIEALKKAKQLLKQYRQSVLKAAVTGELTKEWREANKDKLEQFKAKGKTPKDDKWKVKYRKPEPLEKMPDNVLPDSWRWAAISQVFDVYVGAMPTRKKPEYWNGELNLVSSGEVAFCRIRDTKETITQDGLKNSSAELHPPGTVMLGMIGEGKTRVQAAILEITASHNQNTSAIEMTIPGQYPDYLYFYLMQQYELTRKRGSGVNQKALNITRAQSIEFPLPPLKEQGVITDLLTDKFSAIEHLEKEIDIQLKKTVINKQSVLASAFSGSLN
jgi:hypothetical protein